MSSLVTVKNLVYFWITIWIWGLKKVVMLSMFKQNIGTWWTHVFHSAWNFNACLMQSVVPIGWVVLRDEHQPRSQESLEFQCFQSTLQLFLVPDYLYFWLKVFNHKNTPCRNWKKTHCWEGFTVTLHHQEAEILTCGLTSQEICSSKRHGAYHYPRWGGEEH